MANTHIPTIWDERNVVIEDRDWIVRGISLESRCELDLWVTNKSDRPFTAMRGMICIPLKRANGFNQQTADNKEFGKSIARVRSGNPQVPRMQSDLLLADCQPGESVHARGKLWFEGAE